MGIVQTRDHINVCTKHEGANVSRITTGHGLVWWIQG